MLFSSVIRVFRDYVCVMVRCLVIGQNCDDLKFKKMRNASIGQSCDDLNLKVVYRGTGVGVWRGGMRLCIKKV